MVRFVIVFMYCMCTFHAADIAHEKMLQTFWPYVSCHTENGTQSQSSRCQSDACETMGAL